MKRSFYGIDANKTISLFEYGLLVRYIGDNTFDVVYGIESGGCSYTTFDRTTTTESDINAIIDETWFDKSGFFNSVGMDESEWLKSGIAIKIFELRSYYGVDNIFGSSYYSMTASEVAKTTKTKQLA